VVFKSAAALTATPRRENAVTALGSSIRNLIAGTAPCRIKVSTTSQSAVVAPSGATALNKFNLAGSSREEAMFHRKATILCIDDHWSGLIGRKVLLEQSGYEVLEATDGDDGLKLFRTRPVDAVVLDYQMPGMNGDVVAAKMKRINSNVPIMLLSAYGPLPQSKLESIDSFVSKSQPPNDLLSSLQSLLEEQPKPFFSRWLDHWRNRNQGVTH
jgi:CheY-like chemotaxis protein